MAKRLSKEQHKLEMLQRRARQLATPSMVNGTGRKSWHVSNNSLSRSKYWPAGRWMNIGKLDVTGRSIRPCTAR